MFTLFLFQAINFIYFIYQFKSIFDDYSSKITKQDSNGKDKSFLNSLIKDVTVNEKSTINIHTSPKIQQTGVDLLGVTASQSNSAINFVSKKLKLKAEQNSSQFSSENHHDIDELEFEQAIEFDKRNIHTIYICRIKSMHPIYICIFPEINQLKSTNIAILIICFSCDFAFNAFFYSDIYLSNIYYAGYNFLYEIPKYILTSIITLLLKFFLHVIRSDFPKKSKMKEELKIKTKEEIFVLGKKIKNENVWFFIIIFILTLLFWYFVTAFCGVYQKTQFYWIYGTLTSFGISLIFPFFTSFLCSIFRKLSVQYKWEGLFHLKRILSNY